MEEIMTHLNSAVKLLDRAAEKFNDFTKGIGKTE